MAVHGAFVFALFGPRDISFIDLSIAAFSIFISHGISHMTNFIGMGERGKVSVPELFTQPYRRMALLHITIIITGGLVLYIGTPLPALIAMIILKINFDVAAHIHEHERFKDGDSAMARKFMKYISI